MKKQILDRMDEIGVNFRPTPDNWQELREFIQSLPDEQPAEPARLDFQFPVPPGMEVVTRDGRKVEQLTEFKGVTYPYAGVIVGEEIIRSWPIDGRYSDEKEVKHDLDLFLRPIERKVWVVEGNDDYGNSHTTMCSSKDALDNYVQGMQTEVSIYEATLKPINKINYQ